MVGRTQMQRVLAENSAHRFGERALAGAALAEKDQRSLGLLVGVLHGPRQPIDEVAVDIIVAGRQHFVDVLAHQAPLAALRCDAPSEPEIEFAVDDLRAAWLENYSRILP